MRKVRLVKVVIPEIVAYMGSDPDINNMEPDYQCPECGFGVADDYVYCPHCGAELELSVGESRENEKSGIFKYL